jgi:glycosyltransferase involved in cell wall biosynthesis
VNTGRRDNSNELLLAAYRPAWVDENLVARLRRHFDVSVATVRRRDQQRKTSVEVSKAGLVATELGFFVRLLATPRLYRRGRRFVCQGGHYGTLLFARLLKALGREPEVILLNFYLHGLRDNRIVVFALSRLLRGNVRIVSQSPADTEYFLRFVEADRVLTLPYAQGSSIGVEGSDVRSGPYVFSGGWTNRDYDALLRCAAQLPDISFTIVASAKNRLIEQAPANVRLLLDIDQAEFNQLLAGSKFVVIPLQEDVGSSGQMVLLSAMELGKPVIVPRVGAVTEYVEDGVTGVLYELGDEQALAGAIREVEGAPDRVAAMGAHASEAYRNRFTPEHFYGPVVDYIAGGQGNTKRSTR